MHFIHLFENDFYALFPELFLTTVTMVLLMFGVVWSTSKAHGYPVLVHTVAWLGVWSVFYTHIQCMPFSVMVCFYNSFVIDERELFKSESFKNCSSSYAHVYGIFKDIIVKCV